MATDWTRVPVVVGAGQVTNREEDPARAPDPLELMARAAHDAIAAARAAPAGGTGGGTGGGAGAISHCWMVHSLSLRHGDPAAALAERVGAVGAETRCSGVGGSIPQWLVNRAAELVAGGGRPRVLIAGAEALATRRRARKLGVELAWPSSPGQPDTWPPLEPDLGVHRVEAAHGLDQATAMYALVESAVAHAAGHDPAAQRRSMGVLMDRFNAVAAANPLSWFPTRRDGDELTTVTPDNRMIFFPYPKYLNAVMDVDMGAAVLVTDAATARSWGLGPEDVAYISGWADAHDVWYLSERRHVHTSPALVECAAVALGTAGVGIDEVGAFDLYACFPSSIEVARDSVGIGPGDTRPLTLTGGLPYHGGPGSNYVTHAVANALEWLRAGKGDVALVHGNGYYLTKQAVGVYTRRPPAQPPVPPAGVQERIDGRSTTVPVAPSFTGAGTIVAYTVPYGRDGAPGEAVLLLDIDAGHTLARTDAATSAALVGTDAVGAAVSVSASEHGNVARLK
jgi:acetyl-CoA C-acetyltransferase